MEKNMDQFPVQNQPRRNSITEPPFMSTEDTSLRAIILGSSGHQQFSLTESILQSAVFDGADPHTILTTKTSGSLFGRNVTLVNTPNLDNYKFKEELKKAVRFSCPGPHAVLFTVNPLDMPPNAYEIFKPVVEYFGEQILDNTMIVLYHEEEQWRQSLEDKVMKNRDFRELLDQCHRRCLVFNGRRKESSMAKELLDKIDEMVAKHGVFSNLEYKDVAQQFTHQEIIVENQEKEGGRCSARGTGEEAFSG
ncbi:GTPase IMAP family member 9-like [Ictalurus punctatus]|uniref:GTPase IMAP family member 9-like n=1 Tax=Ictalurus punctatus TaxID=7998 RepID=A0A9F7R6S5_ICTPU|nr:GTPase IMAP family member 9-like [Ictalurus punctatus]